MTSYSAADDTPLTKGGLEGLLVVGLLSIVAWAPFLYPGYIQTHSGLGAVYDALAIRLSLGGQLPAYGVPGDEPLAAWLLALLGFFVSSLTALKLLYIVGFVLSGMGMFMLVRRLWGNAAGLVAAIVSMLIPYRLVVVYVRGALAESLILACAPLLVLALHEAMLRPRWTVLLTTAVLTAFLVLVNAGLGLLVALLALLLAGILNGDFSRRSLLLSVSATVIGLLLGLIFMLAGGHTLWPNHAAWHEHVVYPHQLLAPGWGFGESVPGWQDGISFQLGLVPVVLAILALWGVGEEHRAAQRRTVLALWLLACVLIFLMLPIAEPVWRLLPFPALLAYPWQLLGLAAVILALLAGVAVHTLTAEGQNVSFPLLAVLVAATVLASYAYLSPRYLSAADLPDLTHPPLAQLGDDILLLDARVETEARPGGTLRVTLIWQARRQPAADFTIFAHLLDAQGNRRGQQDMRPHNGNKPTNTWLRGEVVRDDLAIPVAADAPSGDYHLSMGMYLLATMERLPIVGSDRREVILGPITIR